jgi:hypothetical protein
MDASTIAAFSSATMSRHALSFELSSIAITRPFGACEFVRKYITSSMTPRNWCSASNVSMSLTTGPVTSPFASSF